MARSPSRLRHGQPALGRAGPRPRRRRRRRDRRRRAVGGADAVVDPGRRSFRTCMRALASGGSDRRFDEFAASGRPVFGVCVGMQVLFEGSEEDPEPGLGLLAGDRPSPAADGAGSRTWDGTRSASAGRRTPSTPVCDGAYFYFVHSYAAGRRRRRTTVGVTEYGTHVRRRRRARRACSRRSSTRRSPATRGLHALRELRQGGARRDRDPGDRPARRPRGPPAARRPRGRDRLLRRPGRPRRAVPGGGRPPLARRRPGCRARGRRQPRGRSPRSAVPSWCPYRSGAGCGRSRTIAVVAEGRGRPRRSSGPRRRSTRPSCCARSRSTRNTSSSPSTSGAAT